MNDKDKLSVSCEQCGWKKDVSNLTKERAFQLVQDHEDIKHEGSKIKWDTIN